MGVSSPAGLRIRLSSLKRSALWALSGASSSVGGSQIALTYDDGPHPDFTPVILDALGAAGVQGTFFMLGSAALECPDLVRRAIAEGHRVGAHGMAHVDLRTLSAADALADVRRSVEVLSEISGTSIELFRPPFRGVDLRTAMMLRRTKLQIEMANCDSYDWKEGATAESIADRVRGAAPGCTVLLHDTFSLSAAATVLVVDEPHRFVRLAR